MMAIQRAQPLVTQVYEHLRKAVLAGELGAGEKVNETQIAANLKVSRSPVREAIRLLTTEQLFVERDGTITVFRPNLSDFMELYEVRLALEPVAASMAATNETSRKALLTRLGKNIADTQTCLQNGRGSRLVELNHQFHRTIWELAGNQRFMRILDNISDLMQYYCLIVLGINKQQTNILQEHIAVFDAISSGQADAARQSMLAHINRDLEVIQSRAGAD